MAYGMSRGRSPSLALLQKVTDRAQTDEARRLQV